VPAGAVPGRGALPQKNLPGTGEAQEDRAVINHIGQEWFIHVEGRPWASPAWGSPAEDGECLVGEASQHAQCG